MRLVCQEDKTERLLAELARHTFDLVLTDTPVWPSTNIRAFSHLLGECDVTFFGAAKPPGSIGVASRGRSTVRPSYSRRTTRRCDGPSISGSQGSESGRCCGRNARIARCSKCSGGQGRRVFAAPSVIEAEVRRVYGVASIGRAEAVREQFYAISLERRLERQAVIAITEAARSKVFASHTSDANLVAR